ncbi:MAG: DUF1571 domain-containing protein [Candidatus Omnitrophica bacterium]|nr:DUF1571 domain-containing protein [Candidatus Omnitrophota bacterium]
MGRFDLMRLCRGMLAGFWLGLCIAASPMAVAADGAPASASADLDQAVRLTDAAMKAYGALDSYQAVMHRDRVTERGTKSDIIFIRFEKPFSVFMKWIGAERRGQQLLYVPGKFDDQLLCKPPGFFFEFIPIVHMDRDDPRIMKEEAQPIDRAGIGYFLEKFDLDLKDAIASGKVIVRSVREGLADDAPAVWVDVVFDAQEMEYPRLEIGFSETNHLPVAFRLYRNADDLAAEYVYADLKLDPTREDPEFLKEIDRRILSDYLTV